MCKVFLFIVENLYNFEVNIDPGTVLADPFVTLDSVKRKQEMSLETSQLSSFHSNIQKTWVRH